MSKVVAKRHIKIPYQGFAYLLIAPTTLLILALYAYPLYVLLIQSFSKVSLINAEYSFVGLDNYRAIFNDPKFYESCLLTLKYTTYTVGLKILIGFLLALFLSSKLYFKKSLRFLTLLPWAMPQVVVAILWQWVLDGENGYLNYILLKLGIIDQHIAWLSDPKLALISAVVVDAWLGISFVAMVFIAALQNIPRSLYEAAALDGAGQLRSFIHVTLAGIKKVMLVTTLLVTIWSFTSFNVIFALTGGGPFRSTETLVIKIYQEAFANFNMGASSALAVCVCIILLALISVFYYYSEKQHADS